MWIRWRKWKQSNTGIKIADPRQDCFFSPENEGLVDIKWKQVIERLLNHPNEFEIAYDKLGVFFDESGREVTPEMEPIVGVPEVIERTSTIEIQGPPELDVITPKHTMPKPTGYKVREKAKRR